MPLSVAFGRSRVHVIKRASEIYFVWGTRKQNGLSRVDESPFQDLSISANLYLETVRFKILASSKARRANNGQGQTEPHETPLSSIPSFKTA